MTRVLVAVAILALVAPALSACENTIRGVGRDASKTVTATKRAVVRTGRAIAD